jgi:hypothetical protein
MIENIKEIQVSSNVSKYLRYVGTEFDRVFKKKILNVNRNLPNIIIANFGLRVDES